MIIDGHTHGFHGKYLEPLVAAGGSWFKEKIDKERERARSRPQSLDIYLRVKQLDKYGIDFQVVTPGPSVDCNNAPVDAATRLAVVRAVNDNMGRLMEDSKGRLIAGGTVPLASFELGGRREMERAIKTVGLKAISVSSHIGGKPLDSQEFEPFWAQAAEMDVTVFIHPKPPVGHNDRSYEAEYDLCHTFGWPFETILMLSRLVFSGVMERYPTLKIVSHHLGGGVPFWWGRIVETYEPAEQKLKIGRVLAKPLFDYFSRFYYDTAVGGSASAIKCAYEVFGAGQLVFATDAPNGPGDGSGRLASYPGVIKSLGLSKAENKKIFEDNISKLLHL